MPKNLVSKPESSLALALILALSFPSFSWSSDDHDPNFDPPPEVGTPVFETELVELSGSVSYRYLHGSNIVGANQIVISLQPFRGLLPTKIVLDLEKGVINQTEIEFLRILVGGFQLGFPAYVRNIEAGVVHDIRGLSVQFPAYVETFGTKTLESPVFGSITIAIGSDVGYRFFLENTMNGFYIEPELAVQMTGVLLSRIFLSTQGQLQYAILPGVAPNYKTAQAQIRLMLGLNSDSSLRIGAYAGFHYYEFLKLQGQNPNLRSFGARIEWDGTGLP